MLKIRAGISSFRHKWPVMPFAPAPYTAKTGIAASVSIVVPEFATEYAMRSSALNLIAALAVTLALRVPALAQENPAQAPGQMLPPQPTQPQLTQPMDSDNHRFVFHRLDGSFLRLDMRTGAVAVCSPKESDWTCVPGRDEHTALDRQIAQLQRDNAILKNALLEHGVPLPDGMVPAPPSGAGMGGGDEAIPRPPQTVPPTSALPGTPPPDASYSDEIHRITGVVEKAWRHLVEMMKNLQHDLQKDLQKKE
jgi:hypothetical protein